VEVLLFLKLSLLLLLEEPNKASTTENRFLGVFTTGAGSTSSTGAAGDEDGDESTADGSTAAMASVMSCASKGVAPASARAAASPPALA